MELFRVFLYAAQEYNILKFAEICVAILDDRLSGFFFFWCFYCLSNIYEMKPDIFKIFRTFSRCYEKNFQTFRKKSGVSGTY